LDLPAIRHVLLAHRWWGLAGHLWIVTGGIRIFIEKGTGYYLQNYLFHTKMGLLILLVALEAGPLIVLREWRKQLAVGAVPDTARARRFSSISTVQAVLVVLMVIVATGMARGYGSF
jgi:putative membrane protein